MCFLLYQKGIILISWAYRVYLLLIRAVTGQLFASLSLRSKKKKLDNHIGRTQKTRGSFE